ncbi:hypothetical protein O9992_21805 [Vibrio lentus]|nr:hypothetical protein [Vibrio lentus]
MYCKHLSSDKNIPLPKQHSQVKSLAISMCWVMILVDYFLLELQLQDEQHVLLETPR